MRANGVRGVGTLDRVREDGLLQVGACLLGVIAVLYAFACAPQPGQVATPTFNPEGGTFTDSVDVTIACGTEGATIRCTTDGSDPNGSSAECTGAIHLTSTTTLKARASMAGMTDSEVASATYTRAGTGKPLPGVATPTFSPNGGSFTDSVDVTIACATGTATIRYTTDGSDPDGTSTAYTGPIELTETTTVKARGFKAGMTDSAVASATFTVVVATPTFSPEGGTYGDWVDVTIACATAGATIRYTTDGSDPDGTSTTYTAPIQLTETTTIKAIASKSPLPSSAVAEATYAIKRAKLVASDGAAGDKFGCSVSVSGDVAVVGAWGDDDNGPSSGSAYVYRWDGTSWAQEPNKLLASDGASSDVFGNSVSVSGDVAVVGAYGDDDKGDMSGSAYVFRWNGTSWAQEPNKLLASDGAASDYFGSSVSVSGEVAVVGAFLDDNANGTTAGSAYVFRWNGTSWVEQRKLVASDGAAGDEFGYSVSVSGNVVVVGACKDDDNGSNSGSAYVFRWNGTSWVEEPNKLLASDGALVDYFGNSVSVSGDVAVVGAAYDDDNGSYSGSAYVYRWDGTSWAQEPNKLLASDGAADDYFGYSVSVSGDVVVGGARGDDDKGDMFGSAYVYRWNGTSWVEQPKLLASDGAADDAFGYSVSVSGNVAVVGAKGDDSDKGSAYVFGVLP